MMMHPRNLIVPFLLVATGCWAQPRADQKQPDGRADAELRYIQSVALPGVEGRFDHFAVDVKGDRLFLAALGNNTMEAIEGARGARAGAVQGLHKPTGIAFVPESG